MSVTVRHLNGDSTFLLLFSPEPNPTGPDLAAANGAYSVLIDPWITGSSVISAKWFAVTELVQPSAITHLTELDVPDVVICSQNKPDHTHKETLLQLKPEGKTIFAAEPGAAKVMKSWNYFDPNRIHSLSKYDSKAKFGNSLRLYIPPLSSEGIPGEITISFIPAKNYLTGLHNAIGITYQPPTRVKTLASVTTIDLPKTKYFHIPRNIDSMLGNTPPEPSPVFPNFHTAVTDPQDTAVSDLVSHQRGLGHRPQLSRSSNTASSELLSFPQRPSIRPSLEDLRDERLESNLTFSLQSNSQIEADELPSFISQNLPTPPDSPNPPVRQSTSTWNQINGSSTTPKSSISTLNNSTSSQSRQDSRPLSTGNKPPMIHPAKPKAISIIYTPHGISKPDLFPYVRHHLTRLPGALPLTLLLHSFDSQTNPWYLGGNVIAGATGGIEIAKALMARCWISAHDELKDDRGIAVKLIKTERMTAEDIRRELARDAWGSGYGWTCDVRSLASGNELTLSNNERDLLVGSTREVVRQQLQAADIAMTRIPVINAGG